MILAALLLAASVPNGTFDKNVDGWFLVNNSGAAKLEHARKKKALRFTKERAGGMDLVRCNLKSIPDPGSEIEVKATFTAKGVGNGWFKIFWYDANGESLGQGRDVKALRGTYKKKAMALDQQVPESATSAAIMILLVLPGELLVDDVSIAVKKAAKTARKPLTDKKLVRWLDKHAFQLTDLKRLDRHVKGARVVQLGENTHGDGLAFETKVQLIRYLHQKHGFDVVAFESGLYECDRATRRLKPGADPREVMRASVFPIWHTRRTLPLFEYLIEQSGTRAPMALTGVDLQQSGRGAADLIPEAKRLCGLDSDDPKELHAVFTAKQTQLEKEHGAREVAFLMRCLDQRIQYGRLQELKGNDALNFRDKWMAANLSWLVKERYPRSKVVYWAATAHQAHGLDGVRRAGKPMYDGITMAGVHAKKEFGRAIYTIAFVSHGGWAGTVLGKGFEIPAPQEGSIEDLLHRYGNSRLFVPLDGAPFQWPLPMAPMSYARDMEADWSTVVDAVVYFDEMNPAEPMR